MKQRRFFPTAVEPVRASSSVPAACATEPAAPIRSFRGLPLIRALRPTETMCAGTQEPPRSPNRDFYGQHSEREENGQERDNERSHR